MKTECIRNNFLRNKKLNRNTKKQKKKDGKVSKWWTWTNVDIRGVSAIALFYGRF